MDPSRGKAARSLEREELEEHEAGDASWTLKSAFGLIPLRTQACRLQPK